MTTCYDFYSDVKEYLKANGINYLLIPKDKNRYELKSVEKLVFNSTSVTDSTDKIIADLEAYEDFELANAISEHLRKMMEEFDYRRTHDLYIVHFRQYYHIDYPASTTLIFCEYNYVKDSKNRITNVQKITNVMFSNHIKCFTDFDSAALYVSVNNIPLSKTVKTEEQEKLRTVTGIKLSEKKARLKKLEEQIAKLKQEIASLEGNENEEVCSDN